MKPFFLVQMILSPVVVITIAAWTSSNKLDVTPIDLHQPPSPSGKDTLNSELLCPPGKDTTFLICPFKGYVPGMLEPVGLPLKGVWEPPLQNQNGDGYYDSCIDSMSRYLFNVSTPGCPDVQDTAYFKLKWHPPCGWGYEACHTSDQFELTIPPYPEFTENNFLVTLYVAVGQPDFQWTSCGQFPLHSDSTQTISCAPGWNNNNFQSTCVDVRLSETNSGCGWYFPPFDHDYEYWDCELTLCPAVSVDAAPLMEDILVYPVPADEIVIIQSDKPITEIIISGADGRLYKQINPGSNKIDVADLGPGWYIIRIHDGHQWYQARIVK
jgi:hypothetical protein